MAFFSNRIYKDVISFFNNRYEYAYTILNWSSMLW